MSANNLNIDENTKGVELVEVDTGFELRITNKDGSIDVAQLTVPNRSSSVSDRFKNYTPGTRYAVVSKNEIDYAKIS